MNAPLSPVTAVTFRKRPLSLLLWLAMGLVFTGQGFATALFLGTASDLDPPLRAVVVGVALFLAFVGAWFAAKAWARLAGPADAISIGPAGLHDRLISAEPIPWRAIRNLHVARGTRGATVLAFDLKDGDRRGIGWWPRLAEPVNRAFGHGYYVFVMGTEATVERLASAASLHAPVREPGS